MSNSVIKTFLTPQNLMDSSMQLAEQVYKSGFRPNFIVALWRGGTPVGIVIQELYEYFGVQTDHIAIRTSYYSGVGKTNQEVRVHGLEYLIRNINSEDSLLIVDDVFDSGNSVQAVIDKIHSESRKNAPHEIRIAAPYYKPQNNKTQLTPNYFVHTTNEWLVFPHELTGLTAEEIKIHKPWIHLDSL